MLNPYLSNAIPVTSDPLSTPNFIPQLSPSAPYPEWHSAQPPATHLRAPKIPFCSMTPYPFLAQRKSLAQSYMWPGVEGP